MDLNIIKITDLVTQMGISSRSLRYYEQVGLIQSIRLNSERYRYYNEANVERLQQILVLRKMEIPIKDIIRIYESADMSIVVETFVNRIRIIDEELDALRELRVLVNDFLQDMLQSGIRKISALPILYEQMEKRLDTMEQRKPITYTDLSALSNKLNESVRPAIIELPSMRVLSSGVDIEKFQNWIQSKNILWGKPGQHEQFELQDEMLLRISDDFENDSVFQEQLFQGGLYAAANVYLDEDLEQHFQSLMIEFGNNKFYEVDYTRQSMLENLLSPDDKRELISLLLPVKRRLANSSLFDAPKEIQGESVKKIETANPILWSVDVPLDSLIPINNPYYRINEDGEAEYISWINTRTLSTNVEVKLPFRVDIEFICDEESYGFSYGSDEGSIRFYHGYDTNHPFGVNMGNRADERLSQHAIQFDQPLFGDRYFFPQCGAIMRNEYNHITWIVGENHLAVFINNEMRYCGIEYTYMSQDFNRHNPLPIVIGSDGQGKKLIRSICVSQLSYKPKNKIKEGVLIMNTRQSNNTIPNIHKLITSEYGENYWFNGCASYVMESLGEKDYDYWFFAGLTGDNFTQVYAHGNAFLGDGLTDYLCGQNAVTAKKHLTKIFELCGYAATFVSAEELQGNSTMYQQTLMAYIDKGVPVIVFGLDGPPYGVIVGYEEHGQTLLYMTGNQLEPKRLTLAQTTGVESNGNFGWIFVGDKKEQKDLQKIYRDTIIGLPKLLNTNTETYCFGAKAFRAWATEIENGRFDGMPSDKFDDWFMYTVYVCCLATNSGGCRSFLNKAQELNPDFTFLEDVRYQYRITGLLWDKKHESGDGFAEKYKQQNGSLPDNLEALGGGFNVTLETLQNPKKRAKIVAVIRKFADCIDEVVRILNENI